mmetsp:Transcript_52966/g.147509  ORF Transcript_52966/g.147509 Transcript_52966/m.147509 type:complete len:310 (-) Transcript_52966:98-1027(-)
MQSCFRSASAVMSSLRAFLVTARSPSVAAFFSPLSASAFLALATSFVAAAMRSSKDCFNNAKLCSAEVSAWRALDNSPCALSERSARVSTMDWLWLAYAAAEGAPSVSSNVTSPSSGDCAAWTSAERRDASAERSPEDCTMAPSAVTRSSAPLPCKNDFSPFCISLSTMPPARSSSSMISNNSFSEAAKPAASLVLTAVADFNSSSSEAIAAVASSILVLRAVERAVSDSIAASRFATSAFPVLISNCRFRPVTPHHSENSLYTFAASSPCLVILSSRFDSSSNAFETGVSRAALASPAEVARIVKATR